MNELIQEIKHTLVSSELCNQSGALIYSSIKTLKKGDIYFLGLNPGGVPDEKSTILDHFSFMTRNGNQVG